MAMPVTAFKYLADVTHCWRTDEPRNCIVCGLTRAKYRFVDRRTIYSGDSCICEPCVRAGRLAERNLRVNEGDLTGLRSQLKSAEPEMNDYSRHLLAAKRTDEVERRTPRPNVNSAFIWPIHCGNDAVFLNRIGSDEIDGSGTTGKKDFLTSCLYLGQHSLDLTFRAGTDSLNYYLWRCCECLESVVTFDRGYDPEDDE